MPGPGTCQLRPGGHNEYGAPPCAAERQLRCGQAENRPATGPQDTAKKSARNPCVLVVIVVAVGNGIERGPGVLVHSRNPTNNGEPPGGGAYGWPEQAPAPTCRPTGRR
jgi:hypothetical protein